MPLLTVFGGMYFYRSMFNFMPMPNAAFGSSFCHGTFLLLFRHFVPYGAARHPRPGKGPRLVRLWLASRWSRSKAGGGGRWLLGLLCLLRCIVCLLGLLLCACFRLSLPLLGFLILLQLAPCLVRVCAGRGNRFALGTGGIRWSLLVGGLGPVLSIPKLCFKPFRRLSAVGFVLGWHREPHLITTLQAPFSIGYCRTHGGNHRGWTSCGDR